MVTFQQRADDLGGFFHLAGVVHGDRNLTELDDFALEAARPAGNDLVADPFPQRGQRNVDVEVIVASFEAAADCC